MILTFYFTVYNHVNILYDDPLPDYIIVEQIDNLNRKLIDTKEQTIIYETLYKSSKDGEYWIWLSNKSDGPAEINYINNFKTIHRIIYFNKGHVHRLDGPAYISYLHDGKICYQIKEKKILIEKF